MNIIFKQIFALNLIVLLLISCGSQPKVIEPSNSTSASSETGIFGTADSISSQNTNSGEEEIHTVEIIETIPTQKYSYLKVKEGEKEFWIATLKGDFTIGDQYHYTGGLLKQNFKSEVHNRVFEELYLVSNIVPLNHGNQDESSTVAWSEADENTENIEVAGSMRIADLVAKATDFEGKTVQISGKVTKVNTGIMGRNWIHLQDGSKNDYDLVLTADEAVPVGHIVTYKATVAVNKDFGAGYSYALILENGELIK